MNGLTTFTIHDYARYVDANGGMTDDRGLRLDAMMVECGRRELPHLVEGFMSGQLTAGEVEAALRSEATS
jgi:hypothetical protein